MTDVNQILETIENACNDWQTSNDAMRWKPQAPAKESTVEVSPDEDYQEWFNHFYDADRYVCVSDFLHDQIMESEDEHSALPPLMGRVATIVTWGTP